MGNWSGKREGAGYECYIARRQVETRESRKSTPWQGDWHRTGVRRKRDRGENRDARWKGLESKDLRLPPWYWDGTVGILSVGTIRGGGQKSIGIPSTRPESGAKGRSQGGQDKVPRPTTPI